MSETKPLTDEQKQRLELYKEKWAQYGLSCEPVDLEKVRPLIDGVYAMADVAPPRHKFLTDSPIDAAATIAILEITAATDFVDAFFNNIGNVLKFMTTEAKGDVIEHTAQDFFQSALAILDPQ